MIKKPIVDHKMSEMEVNNQDPERWIACALNGSPPTLCTITQIVVSRHAESDEVWLLSPSRGLIHPVTTSTLQSYAADELVHLLHKNERPFVAPQDFAFCVSPEFLGIYRQVCEEEFPWEGLPLSRLSGSGHLACFGEFSRLQILRRNAAGRFLSQLDRRIPLDYPTDNESFLDPFLPGIENWGRWGALCVGSDQPDYYWTFHQRIAAAVLLMPGESERLRLIFDLQVSPYYPDISYERYAEDARVVAGNWREQSVHLRAPSKTIRLPGYEKRKIDRILSAA